MEKTMNNNLRCCMMLLLVMASVLVGVCQVPKTGFSAQATSLNFYFNDDPSVYAYSGQTRTVSATVQLSILVDGTFIPGVHAHPSWTVSISGPDPNNPQQTTTVGSAIFTHPGPYTNANVSVTLPAAAGAYTYTASLTGGEGTATLDTDTATIVQVSSLVPSEGIEFDDGDNDPDTKSYVVPIAATGSVTVTATPYASVAEDELPSEWSFTGGTAVGLGKLQQTVSKNSPGLTTLFCSCGESSKTVSLYLVAVDLQCGELSETTEDTPGAFIGINDNDDNVNGIADVNEQLDTNGNVTVTNEADLVPVSLFIADHPAAGTVTLSGGSAIKVWTNSTKGTQITLPASWTFTPTSDTMPTIVYVEGITPSSSVRDTSLVLTYSYGAVSISDSLTITVVKTAIGGPGAEGIIAIVNRDDDNGNDTADVNDTGSVTGENELVPITLNLYPANLDAGSLILTLPSNLKGWSSSTKGTATALSWTIPVGGGAFTPITVYLEGTAASRAVRDGEVKLAYSNSGKVVHTSKARSTVADLTVSLTDNVILTNTDDDDTNSASDLGQTGPITSENDLKQLRITLEPAGLTGTFTASARTVQFGDPDENGHRPITGYGTKKVNFFMDAAKGIVPPSGMSWTLNGTTPAPDALWLEGASVSTITDDQELTVQLAIGGYTLSAVTTATVNAHPGSSEVTFKLYEQSPIGQDKEVLNNEISGAVGGMVYVVMEVKLGPGEKLASSSATVRIKDTWSGYENGVSRGWMDIPVDFSSSEWCEMLNQSNGGCDLTWTTAAPAGTDNANGAMYRSFYMVIKEWNTLVEPYAEYYKQATDSWVHFDNPTVGHNGSHEISVVAVDDDTAQTALEFQHYDATANPPGWQDPVEVNVAPRNVTVSNLVVTNLSPGKGTIDYIKYDPDPDGKYHRPTMNATFNDNNPSGQQHYYVSYWMLLATANPVLREHLNMNDVYSRSDAVINTYAIPTSVDFTWYGTVGEVSSEDILDDEECDVADWGTYTYDVDVIEYDENHEMVDWHSYKWPSGLSIGEHTLTSEGNDDCSESVLSYTYVVSDVENQNSDYYPNAKEPTDIKVVFVDELLDEQLDSGLDWDEYGVVYSGEEFGGANTSFCKWRSIYTGQDNCWEADRREHIPSRMLALNKEAAVVFDLWESWVERRATFIAKSLKDSNWDYIVDGKYTVNDSGAFGKEVGKRLTTECQNTKPGDGSRFYSNIVINQTTRKVQWYNVDPTVKAVPNTCKEIDLIRCKKGYTPVIGEPLDSSKILSAWEIKNSISGSLTRDTKNFYLSVCNKSHVVRVASGYRYKVVDKSFQIVDEVRYVQKSKLLKYIAILGVAGELINASRIWLEDPAETKEYQDLQICIGEVKNNPGDDNCLLALHVSLMTFISDYLDPQIVAGANIVGLIHLSEYW